MRRRQLLDGVAGLVFGGLAGCTEGARPGTAPESTTTTATRTDSGTPSPLPDDAYTTLTYDAPAGDADRADPLAAAASQRTVGPYHLAVLARREHADAALEALPSADDADPAGFLDATDFDTAAVVLVRDLLSSSVPDLQVRAVRRGSTVVELDLEYPGEGGTDDLAEDVALVRVPRDGRALAHATLALTPQYGEGVTLSTVGRYGRAQLDPPRDVVVRNRDCVEHGPALRATIDGELVYLGDRRPAAPGSVVHDAGVLGEAGDYRVVVEHHVGGERVTTAADVRLETGGDRGVLVDIDGDGAVAVAARPSAELPAAGRIDCEAASVPYESPDPSENLSRPVGITWVNRSDADREVDVTISSGDGGGDGDPIIQRTLALAAGTKGRTEPLIAKRGVYGVDITPSSGEGASVRWDVSKGSLSLLVGEDGRLRVARDALA